MKCQNCGKEFEGILCPNCGMSANGSEPTTSNHQDINPTEYVYTNQPYSPSPQPAKPKKSIFKKKWFIILCAFLVLAFLINLGSCGATTDSEANEDEYVENYENDEKSEITTTKKVTTTVPKLSEKEFKAQCETIAFSTLSRNPDKYKGKKLKFTGEVVQVSETTLFGSTYCDLRINVTKSELFEGEYYWEDTIYATVTIPDGADRILEEDIITIWGTCEGNYTYTSILGSSVSLPKIDIEYFTIGY